MGLTVSVLGAWAVWKSRWRWKYFSKASLRFPANKDAFCLNVISIVRSYTYSLQEKFIDDAIKYGKVQ